MTDEEKMKLAREYAAKTFDARSRKFPNSATMERHHAKVIRQGEGDDYDAVQSALAAINALAPRLEEAEDLLRCCVDKGHSYESEGMLHDMVHAFLKQGAAS